MTEFLTFMRHAALRSSTRRTSSIQAPSGVRTAGVGSTTFAQRRYASGAYNGGTGAGVKTDQYESGSEHAADKAKGNDTYNIQADNAKEGIKGKNDGGADNTTAEADSHNTTAKAKEEHPEAPDVVIGMQDERGGKGG